ncbi:hypothetical protein MRX96_012544 [Rhipicephalus microplus]
MEARVPLVSRGDKQGNIMAYTSRAVSRLQADVVAVLLSQLRCRDRSIVPGEHSAWSLGEALGAHSLTSACALKSSRVMKASTARRRRQRLAERLDWVCPPFLHVAFIVARNSGLLNIP